MSATDKTKQIFKRLTPQIPAVTDSNILICDISLFKSILACIVLVLDSLITTEYEPWGGGGTRGTIAEF
jgi:hypothetical protein